MPASRPCEVLFHLFSGGKGWDPEVLEEGGLFVKGRTNANVRMASLSWPHTRQNYSTSQHGKTILACPPHLSTLKRVLLSAH